MNNNRINMLSAFKFNDNLSRSNICRGCLAKDTELQSIFNLANDRQKPLKFNEMIMKLSTVKINENDNLPSKICNVCIQQTITAYSFMVQVEKSEQTLRNCLVQSTKATPDIAAQENVPPYLIEIEENFESTRNISPNNETIEEQFIPSFQDDNIVSDSDLDDAQVDKNYTIKKKRRKTIKNPYEIEMTSGKSKCVKNIDLPKTETKNQCQICEKHFPDPNSLKDHFIFCINNPTIVIDAIETTVQGTEFITRLDSCSECNVKFETSAELELHQKTIHNLSLRLVNKSMATSGKNIHEMLEKAQPVIRNSKRLKERGGNKKSKNLEILQDNMFECDVCTSLFASEDSFKAHLILHTQLGVATCVYCMKTFEGNLGMVSHVRRVHDPKKSFPCNQCDTQCKSEKSLETHKRIKHTRERTFQCPVCPKRFVELRDMNRHRLTHQTKFPCPICDKTFTFKSSLKVHIPKHSRVGRKSCTQCSHTFKDDFQLDRHVRIMHSGETHECPQCLKVFSHKSRLTQHQLGHVSEEQRRFTCCHCPKKFNHIHHLRNHERTHTGSRPFLCSICGRSFVQSHNLTIHLRQHEATKPYPCQLCNRSFAQSQRLMRHVRIHTGEKPFMCNQCGKCFCDNATLKRHLRTHQEEIENHEEGSISTKSSIAGTKSVVNINNRKKLKSIHHMCKVCGESFANAVTLGVHKRMHTCKYVCDICNRKFFLASTLESHRKSHPDVQRLYGCSECSVSYRRPEHLRSHIRRAHSLDRPYACTHCPAKFCQSGELTVHLRRHTGEKPYVCTVCNKAFAASTSLTIHIRTHTGERPYKCSICTRGFSTSSAMIGHMKTHSSKVVEDIYPEDYIPTNTYQLSIDNDQPTPLVTKPSIDESIKRVRESIDVSSVDKLKAIQSVDKSLRKKIYLVNENNDVTIMETIVECDEDSNRYDTENHITHMPDITSSDCNTIKSDVNITNDIALLESSIKEKNDTISRYNILRSIDGKLTLHLPGNVKLNDGDSFKIDVSNMDLGEGTHILQLDQPLELVGDPTTGSLNNINDETVMKDVDSISNINFEYHKYPNNESLQSKDMSGFSPSLKGRKNKAEQKAIHSD